MQLPPEKKQAILLIGPTASGKTPLGAIIEARGLWGRKCVHFDFGANLRGAVQRNTPDDLIAREDIDFLRGVLDSGALLEDEHFPLAARILRRFLARRAEDQQTDVVLNGLPRHVGQAEAIAELLDVRAVIHLECSGKTIRSRISSNVGGDRSGREDDQTAAVQAKLSIFQQRTLPLIAHYRAHDARIEAVEVTPQMNAEKMWDVLNRR